MISNIQAQPIAITQETEECEECPYETEEGRPWCDWLYNRSDSHYEMYEQYFDKRDKEWSDIFFMFFHRRISQSLMMLYHILLCSLT
jgi:hypothetical protein